MLILDRLADLDGCLNKFIVWSLGGLVLVVDLFAALGAIVATCVDMWDKTKNARPACEYVKVQGDIVRLRVASGNCYASSVTLC